MDKPVAAIGHATLTHPDRIYWPDAGVSKEQFALYYTMVWSPMRPQVAASMAAVEPDRTTANPVKRRRRGRVFIDYLRNSREATAIVPYSTRARPGAPMGCR